MARKRLYTRYAHFQERTGRVVVQKRYDTSKPAVVRVRAHSARQATKLVKLNVRAKNGGPGIVSIRHGGARW